MFFPNLSDKDLRKHELKKPPWQLLHQGFFSWLIKWCRGNADGCPLQLPRAPGAAAAAVSPWTFLAQFVRRWHGAAALGRRGGHYAPVLFVHLIVHCPRPKLLIFRVWALCISVMEDVRRDIWNENSERHWYLSFTTLFASVFFTLQTPQKNLMTFNREHKTYWNWLRMNKIRPNTILHLKLKSRNYLHFPAFKNIFIPLFQLHYLLVHRLPVNVGIALVIT